VADVYDAVTSDRAYRKAMPMDRVLELLESGSGTQFDPSVIAALLPLLHQREFQDEASFALV
jgi:HD-GYP domain-containing protein (c-di-GMP phosphodiesterase class II)